jgi:exopolysaccharide biosynthesis polyprenyl glycosylphosphotransferase
MKRVELAFAALLVPLDYVLVLAAALTAYSLRYQAFSTLRPFVTIVPADEYRALAALAAVVFVACFAMAGLYKMSGPRRLAREVPRILLASAAAGMAVSALIFFRGELFESRFIVLAACGIAALYVALGRIAVRLAQRSLLRHGIGSHRIAVIGGNDDTTRLLTHELAAHPTIGMRVVATFAHLDTEARADLDRLKAAGTVDELFVTRADIGRDELADLLGFAQSRHLGFRYAADLVATAGRNVEVGTIADVPVVEIKGTRLDGWGRVFKRAFDIIGALILIVVTSPIMLITALAVKLGSRGPVFFWRKDDGTPVQRAGERGRPFTFVKFRSMRPNTDNLRYDALAHLHQQEGPVVKIGANDPRITRVGAFIRRYSIDELPQLFLVLRGKMSLVGPRPHVMEEVAKYAPHHLRKLTVKPGITGLSQISGRRDLSFEDEVRLDTYYIENWSPLLDLIILMKTPFAVLRSKGAY